MEYRLLVPRVNKQKDEDWAIAGMLNNLMLPGIFLTDYSSTAACHSGFGGIYLRCAHSYGFYLAIKKAAV